MTQGSAFTVSHITLEVCTFHSCLYKVAMNNWYDALAPSDTAHESYEFSPMFTIVSSQLNSWRSALQEKRKWMRIRIAVVNCDNAAGKPDEINNLCEYINPDVMIMSENKIESSIPSDRFPVTIENLDTGLGVQKEPVRRAHKDIRWAT